MAKFKIVVRCANPACGTEFETSRRKKKFCSAGCKDTYWNALRRASVPAHVTVAQVRREIQRSHRRWLDMLGDAEAKIAGP
jgi:hypothetical protein